MSAPRILLLGPEAALDDTAAVVLQSEGYRVDRAPSGAEALRTLDEGGVDLVVLDLTARSVDGYTLYKALRPRPEEQRPALLLLIGEAQEGDERAVGLTGKSACLTKPIYADQLVIAVRGLLGEESVVVPPVISPGTIGKDGARDGVCAGRVIAVYGAKGGVGKTFLAINLAAALTKTAVSRVAIVDGDLQFGEVAARLRLPVDRNLYVLAAYGANLTWPQLRSALRSHRSGLDAVLAPPQPWLAEHVSGELLARVLRVLKEHYPFVVVDTHTSYDQKALVTLEQADDILLVAAQDPFVRRSALAFLAVAKRLGYLGKVRVVLNFFHPKQTPSIERLERELRTRLIATVRADATGLAARAQTGDPMVGGGGECLAVRDVIALATSIQRLYTLSHAHQVTARPRVPLIT